MWSITFEQVNKKDIKVKPASLSKCPKGLLGDPGIPCSVSKAGCLSHWDLGYLHTKAKWDSCISLSHSTDNSLKLDDLFDPTQEIRFLTNIATPIQLLSFYC